MKIRISIYIILLEQAAPQPWTFFEGIHRMLQFLVNENLLPVHLSGTILMNMASTNSSVILVLETNRNDGFGIFWVVVGLMKTSAFDFGLFNFCVLDDLYKLISSEL